MGLVVRVNEALDANPPPNYERVLTENGSNWLWTVVAIFAISYVCSPIVQR